MLLRIVFSIVISMAFVNNSLLSNERDYEKALPLVASAATTVLPIIPMALSRDVSNLDSINIIAAALSFSLFIMNIKKVEELSLNPGSCIKKSKLGLMAIIGILCVLKAVLLGKPNLEWGLMTGSVLVLIAGIWPEFKKSLRCQRRNSPESVEVSVV